MLWNKIEESFKQKLKKAGIDRGHTFWPEEAMQSGVLSQDDIANLTELRMIRNKQVHSSTLDRKQVEYAVDLAERLLSKLE